MNDSRPLTGVSIAVTRPENQAGALCRLIEDAGGKAVRFPSLAIVTCENNAELRSLAQRLETFDLAIFISANAVAGAARLIGAALPAGLRLAAVGNSTRAAVEREWQRPVLCPAEGANSEALLATGELQHVNGLKIVIFRGQGGRELLAQSLKQRGAMVEYAEVYRRVRPGGDLSALMAACPEIDLITATSNESLQNLYAMANAQQAEWLRSKQLIVISPRGADLAAELGFHRPAIVAAESNDQGLVEAMIGWRKQQYLHH